MLKSLKTLVTAGALLALVGPAWAQNADFSLVNKTGYTIREVYVSPSKANSWGSDVLGDSTFLNGEVGHITFPSSNASCVMDLKVVFEDDNSSVVWEEFDLCTLRKITLKYNRSTGDVSADSE